MKHRSRPIRALLAALSGVALAAVVAVQPAAAATAQEIRVVTANLAAHGPTAVAKDWQIIAPQADVVFFQEAKNVVLRDVLGPAWAVRQDTSSDDRQGSALAVRRSITLDVGTLELVYGTDSQGCGIMKRWIANIGIQLLNGRWLRVSSLHMPPAYCQTGPGGPYDVMAGNVVDFANRSGRLTVLGGDWNKVVDDDPNNIGGRTGLRPRGPDEGARIDGFYVSPQLATWNMHHLPATTSDHRPVGMTVSVPAP